MATATATVARQMPGSGSSCNRDRPGSVFHLLPGNPVYPKWRGLLCSTFFFCFLFFLIAHHQRGSSQPVHQRGNSQPRTFVRDIMAAVRAPCPFSDGTIRQGFNPSCRIPTTRAAMTSPCAFKANLAFRGVPHANTCALPVRDLRRALCEQNTLCRPHRASHTRPPGEPIRSESIYPA